MQGVSVALFPPSPDMTELLVDETRPAQPVTPILIW